MAATLIQFSSLLSTDQLAAMARLNFNWDADANQRLNALMLDDLQQRTAATMAQALTLPLAVQTQLTTTLETAVAAAVQANQPPA